jgi:hypothetical protein
MKTFAYILLILCFQIIIQMTDLNMHASVQAILYGAITMHAYLLFSNEPPGLLKFTPTLEIYLNFF